MFRVGKFSFHFTHPSWEGQSSGSATDQHPGSWYRGLELGSFWFMGITPALCKEYTSLYETFQHVTLQATPQSVTSQQVIATEKRY